ncbi:MAG: hypothetical protein EOP24_36185 [Hyphomicrobiales bacterium]|nr:MAG: hypothetical protein EOP24_36185 [Hyphomicrobiales bacterium]
MYHFNMDEKKTSWGGARPGGGRKPQVAGAPAVVPVTIKLSGEQKEKLRLLGGAQWVRDTLDSVKLTAAKKKLLAELEKARAKESPAKE